MLRLLRRRGCLAGAPILCLPYDALLLLLLVLLL
jgi:hypothetical protein